MNAPTRIRALFAGCLLLLGAPGCRSPEMALTYHQLHAVAEGDPTRRSSLQVEVLPVHLPGMLRRPQLVLPGLVVSDAHRWANGLEPDVQRVLVGNLGQLLGSEAVVAYPQGEGLKGAFRILLTMEQWDAESAQFLALRATWLLLQAGKEQPVCIRKTRLQEPLKDASPAALVGAYDRTLLALSKEMAVELSRQP